MEVRQGFLDFVLLEEWSRSGMCLSLHNLLLVVLPPSSADAFTPGYTGPFWTHCGRKRIWVSALPATRISASAYSKELLMMGDGLTVALLPEERRHSKNEELVTSTRPQRGLS